MQLGELGEEALIARIDRIVSRASTGTGRDVALGIGDDAALLRVRPGEEVVVTTDASVEGVHFDLGHETPAVAGRRALVANLSDLAAMGARPLGFTCALAAPPELPVATALGLARGLVSEGARHGTSLVGGNVTRAPGLSLAITALGAVAKGTALLRSAARAGDRVLVTGVLGRSALERARRRVRHVPTPRIRAGRALARLAATGACIDLSDGLLSDAGHLARASGVRIVLEAAQLPRPRGFATACRRAGIDPDQAATGFGDDYELLFTLRARGPSAAVLTRRLGVPVAEIGRVQAGRGVALAGAGTAPAGAGGFRHF
jgi:thiamine-monophosphate kinase